MHELTQKLIDKAWNSDQLRKQKAQIKRTVTAIGKQRQELAGLLTDAEDKQLSETAYLLDKWAAKAERAFKEKLAAEKAEEQRRTQREQVAEKALLERYSTPDLRPRIVATCAICTVNSPDWPELSAKKIREKMHWIENNQDHQWANSDHLVRDINAVFASEIRSLARSIGYRQSPIDALIEEEAAKIDAEIEKQRLALSELLSEFDKWMVKRQLIEAAGDG